MLNYISRFLEAFEIHSRKLPMKVPILPEGKLSRKILESMIARFLEYNKATALKI